MPRERITRSHFQQALRVVARRLADANSGSVSVDELTGVPYFNPAKPPGLVVQRLIEASILESLPGRPDRVRFSVEAVQDYYQAEVDIEEIKADPSRMAEVYSRLQFTTAYLRLLRIGHSQVGGGDLDEFARRLAELNAWMAAVVLRPAPHRFSPDIRARIADELGQQISSRHRARAAMAITMLGEVDCQESAETLAAHLLPPSDAHPDFKRLCCRSRYVAATRFFRGPQAVASADTT